MSDIANWIFSWWGAVSDPKCDLAVFEVTSGACETFVSQLSGM